MCRMWWPLTLTYIFKVIWPWLWKLCLLWNVFSSRSIIFLTWDPIVWVIMRRRGVSSERRRSSCSSLNLFGLSFKKARLTHWGRVMHICVGKLTIIGSDNGLAPERRQAIIWTNAGILLIGPLETNFSEILIEIQTFSLKKIRLKMSSEKCCSFHLGLNVLIRPTLEFALAISYVLSEISRGIESDS